VALRSALDGAEPRMKERVRPFPSLLLFFRSQVAIYFVGVSTPRILLLIRRNVCGEENCGSRA
jgi:hypothetical protein